MVIYEDVAKPIKREKIVTIGSFSLAIPKILNYLKLLYQKNKGCKNNNLIGNK